MATRKSTIITKPPVLYNDFVCNNVIVPAHWCYLVACESLPSAHHVFVASSEVLKEPLTFVEAAKDQRWLDAINKELTALHANKT